MKPSPQASELPLLPLQPHLTAPWVTGLQSHWLVPSCPQLSSNGASSDVPRKFWASSKLPAFPFSPEYLFLALTRLFSVSPQPWDYETPPVQGLGHTFCSSRCSQRQAQGERSPSICGLNERRFAFFSTIHPPSCDWRVRLPLRTRNTHARLRSH